MKPVRKRYRAFKTRQKARAKKAQRNGARALMALGVAYWLVTTYTVEVLAVCAALAFTVCVVSFVKLARAGRADRVPKLAREVGTAVRTRGGARGPAGSIVGDRVYDEHGKRQYAYTMGGFSWWESDHLEAIKIGHSNAPALRTGQVQKDEPSLEWRLLSYADGGEPRERELHRIHDEHRLPRSELFVPHADVLGVVSELAQGPGGELTAAGTWVTENIDPERYRTVKRS